MYVGYVRWPRAPTHNTHPTSQNGEPPSPGERPGEERAPALTSGFLGQGTPRPGTYAEQALTRYYLHSPSKTPAVNGGGSLASRILRNHRMRDGAALFTVHLPPTSHPSIVRYSPFNHTAQSAKSARHG